MLELSALNPITPPLFSENVWRASPIARLREILATNEELARKVAQHDPRRACRFLADR